MGATVNVAGWDDYTREKGHLHLPTGMFPCSMTLVVCICSLICLLEPIQEKHPLVIKTQ